MPNFILSRLEVLILERFKLNLAFPRDVTVNTGLERPVIVTPFPLTVLQNVLFRVNLAFILMQISRTECGVSDIGCTNKRVHNSDTESLQQM